MISLALPAPDLRISLFRLYGMTNLHMYIYYSSYPRDSKLHKVSVSALPLLILLFAFTRE
jgi:hypothetical protein